MTEAYSEFNKIARLSRECTIWTEATKPSCCLIVPVLYQGIFSGEAVTSTMAALLEKGSVASPGCMRPEGIIIWHTAAQTYFKKTFDKDDEWKGKTHAA